MEGGRDDRPRPSWAKARGGYASRTGWFARADNDLLVDDVFVDPAWLDGWRTELTYIELLLVGVLAPLHTLEQREKARGNRIAGEARSQIDVIHQGIEYDLIVDTSRQSPEECARSILGALLS